MANYAGSAPVGVSVSVSPSAMATEASSSPAPATVSEALAPPAPVADTPVLPQGVVDADAPPENAAPLALDANPSRTATELHAHLTTLNVDPSLATFYQGRVEKALAQPAPTAEQLVSGASEAHQALIDQYGDDAPAFVDMARKEVSLLARDHPQIVEILERTGLGNDVHLIKSLANRGFNRFLTSRGFKVGQ